MKPATLLSLQISDVTEIPMNGSAAWWDKSWTTGFYKRPLPGRVWLAYQGLRGDQQPARAGLKARDVTARAGARPTSEGPEFCAPIYFEV